MISRVEARFGKLPYMELEQAEIIRRLLRRYRMTCCLELGFYHGKSSAFIAAILEEMGEGHLTTIDVESARARDPNIETVLAALGLSHRVTVYFEPRSYTWRLMKMLEESPEPRYDFCYIDGGHSWDVTGFAFFLVDRLIVPGGGILFDDLKYTYARSGERNPEMTPAVARMPQEERETPQVGKVWDLLVARHPLYQAYKLGAWGFARKRRNAVVRTGTP